MQQRSNQRISWFRLGVMLILGYGLFVVVSQQMEINAVNREKKAMSARIEQLQVLNKSAAEEKVLLTTPAYVEKMAREGLGLVKPGEVPYIPAEKN